MILSVETTYHEHGPIRIFDANGLEWTYVIQCDTETGDIERFVTDKEGNRLKDNSREKIRAAAPLRYEQVK